jgi:hypothetical protein
MRPLPARGSCQDKGAILEARMNFRRLLSSGLRFPSTAKTGQSKNDISPTQVLDHYVSKYPSAQNAIDLIPGWNHAFPAEAGVVAGDAHFYHDTRIDWCIEKAAPLTGKTVLELGPLEAMHTYMLAKAGPAHIDAVEANALAYMRCLIAKEILGIANTSFWLGDFNAWLETSTRHYDLIVASGVLYHSADPVRLLELIATSAEALYVWTHYFDNAAMPPDDPRRGAFSGCVEPRLFRDLPVELHERSYHQAWRDPKFCGGLQDRHYWMTKSDIVRLLDRLDFDAEIAHDLPEHPHGPSMSVFARRRASSAA